MRQRSYGAASESDATGANDFAYTSTLLRITSIVEVAIWPFILIAKLLEFRIANILLPVMGAYWAISQIRKQPNQIPTMHSVDLAIIIVCLGELVSYCGSIYRPNSLMGLASLAWVVLLFYLMDTNPPSDMQRTATYITLALAGATIAVVGDLTWVAQYNSMGRLHMLSIYDYRSSFAFGLANVPQADWIVLFICLLPYSVLLSITKNGGNAIFWGGVVVVESLTILMTCSRGLYLGLLCFASILTGLLTIYKLVSLRMLLRRLCLVVGIVVACVISTPLAKPVTTTISMVNTFSQQRSIEGRLRIWRILLRLRGRQCLIGAGTGNFSLLYAELRDADANVPFAARSFNYPLHLVTEKGIIGLAGYAFLWGAFFVKSHKLVRISSLSNVRRIEIVVIMAGSAGLLGRELVNSSLCTSSAVFVLAWFTLGHNLAWIRDDLQ